MAGNGVRTKSLGDYKPFIEINSKKIFEWFLNSIETQISEQDIFKIVTTLDFNEKYLVEEIIVTIFKKLNLANSIEIIISPTTPQGPAKSVELAVEQIESYEIEYPVIVINPDQYQLFKLPPKIETNYLVANIDLGVSKSYAKIDGTLISEIKEKDNISNIASTGVYVFRNVQTLRKGLDYIFSNNITHKDEFYISAAMNHILQFDKIKVLAAIAKLDLGTVENIKYFEKTIEAIQKG